MRQSIRALGWTITISMLLLFAFLATSVYSMVQTILINRGISLSENPQFSFSNGSLTTSFALTINNTGYYDMSGLNVTTVLLDSDGRVISEASTLVERITKGSAITKQHNMSITLTDILSHISNLTQDTELNMNISVGLKYAEALALQVTVMNLSIPWGAPIHNLSLTEITPRFNGTHYLLETFVSFENHAFFDLNGILHLKVYNSEELYIGSGDSEINIEAGHGYSGLVVMVVEDPLNFTESGYVEVSFESPVLGYFDLGRIDYG